MDQRLDTYAELCGMYARNSVTLKHAQLVSRGIVDDHLNITKHELRGRKISNKMDEIMAIIIQDNNFREQVRFKTYHRPSINPIKQQINSPTDADRITAAAEKKAADIMAIVYPNGTDPPEATAGPTATATDTAPPTTATPWTTIVANCLGHRKPHCPASPSFTMNTIEESHPGTTPNPLLTVNTGGEGNGKSFHHLDCGNELPKLPGQLKHHCIQTSDT